MNYKIIDNIIQYIKDYTNNFSPSGLVRFSVDAVLVAITVFFVIKFFLLHSKKEVVLLTIFSMVALLAIISILDLWMMLEVTRAIVIFIGSYCILCSRNKGIFGRYCKKQNQQKFCKRRRCQRTTHQYFNCDRRLFVAQINRRLNHH